MIRKYLVLFLVTPVMMNIGCQPKPSPTAGRPPSPVSLAFEKVEQTCLKSLKAHMLKGDFSFREVSNPQINAEIKNVMATLMIAGADIEYRLSHDVKTNLTTSIEVNHSKKKEQGDVAKYEMRLSVPDKDSEYLFALNLTYSEDAASGINTSLNQRYRIDSNCRPLLIETEYTKTTLANLKISAIHLEEFADGKAGSFHSSQGETSIPSDGILMTAESSSDLKTWESLNTFLSLQKKDAIYYSRTQFAPYFIQSKIDFAPDTEHFDPILGRQAKCHQLIIHIEGMGDILSLFSTNSNFTTSRFGNGDENWTVNSALFESATLSRSASNSNRTFEISSELLAGTQSLRAEFLTSRELKYPNLESYWKVEHKEQVPEPADGLPFKYTLLSQKITAQDQDSDNLIIDPKEKKQNPDLQESANLQISIAPVQAMVAKLQSNGPLNRLQMARLIGKMVTETLTYDYDSVKESSIHALTTTEVLERKKGVCQHFANLFAVLARGVGIPARFITGYYLSPQGVGAHAWNEIEIRSGVWMPIEPQNSNLSLNPMFYFPLVTGGYMETMKDEDAFRDGKAMLIEFHAKALESIR